MCMYEALTRKERQEIRELVYQCANYDRPERTCLLLDIEKGRRIDCPMLNATTIGRVCNYFRNAVLPLNPALEARLGCKEPVEKRACSICGKEYVPQNNRQRYCSEKCKVSGRRKRDRELRREARKIAG